MVTVTYLSKIEANFMLQVDFNPYLSPRQYCTSLLKHE